MSLNDTMARRESQKFKTVLNSIGIVILKVCARVQKVSQKSGMGWGGYVSVWACVCMNVCV